MAKKDRNRSARERILETAARLFHENGYHSVGVDRIVAESGVAKMSFYRHFPSKDALIVAALNYTNANFWEWIEKETTAAKSPRDKLTLLFQAVQKLSTSRECLGCVFQAAASDFPSPHHENHKAALNHKTQVMNYLARLAEESGLQNPKQLAEQLLLLMEGAWASARMYGSRGPAGQVAAAAESLIKASTPRRSKHL